MSDYPLVKRAGLQLAPHGAFVRAADVERLLSDAPVVYGNHDVEGWSARANSGDTHYARLVCVEPIVRDTAEGLLRELIAAREADRNGEYICAGREFLERAKKLLGE